MKPFDLQKALSGHPLISKGGNRIRLELIALVVDEKGEEKYYLPRSSYKIDQAGVGKDISPHVLEVFLKEENELYRDEIEKKKQEEFNKKSEEVEGCFLINTWPEGHEKEEDK